MKAIGPTEGARDNVWVLPDALARKAVQICREDGRRWVKDFPATLAEVVERWRLTKVAPAPDLSYNFVAFVRTDQGAAVLKIGFASNDLREEVKALMAFDGRAAARVLDHDFEKGAVLLERLEPGVSMWSSWSEEVDDLQTEAAAQTMLSLWTEPKEGFKTTRDWCKAYDRFLEAHSSNAPFSPRLVQDAKRIAEELHSDNLPAKLLHGDFHHGNILSSGQDWKVIDPKGIVGEPAFEAGTWIRNPCDRILQVSDLSRLINRRLRIIADVTHIDLKRLHAWSFCVCLLSACWSAEDGEGWSEALACAEILRSTS